MAHEKKDLTSLVFGRWEVLIEAEPDIKPYGKYRRWFCKCSCGKEKIIKTSDLTGGGSRSCGCLRKEQVSARFKKHGF